MRQVCFTDRMRSTQRARFSLQVPRLRLLQDEPPRGFWRGVPNRRGQGFETVRAPTREEGQKGQSMGGRATFYLSEDFLPLFDLVKPVPSNTSIPIFSKSLILRQRVGGDIPKALAVFSLFPWLKINFFLIKDSNMS